MKANELIGKRAVRTAPTKKHGDYSFTDSPIRILKVTDNHILYKDAGDFEETFMVEKPRLLNSSWIDDNWTNYDELINCDTDKLELENKEIFILKIRGNLKKRRR